MRVRKKDGSLSHFDPDQIINSLLKETDISQEVAQKITASVMVRLIDTKIDPLTGPLIREMVNAELLSEGYRDIQRQYTRVGIPIYDAIGIDIGRKGKGDNANLQENAETGHKRKADALCKEQYLLELPEHLAEAHLNGDIHIHDLEYFGSRPFCSDHDLRFFLYYGFVGDGKGDHTSYAKPAMRPEVAILHAVKVLGCAQTNAAGGQGFYNFLTFLAPYFEGYDWDSYKQCMQMFVYEMTQMLVARGGQLVFSSVQLSPSVPELWRDVPIVMKGKIWDGTQAPLLTYGMYERENRLLFKALMEVMIEGDGHGKPFYFPKPEISIEPQFLEILEEEDRSPLPAEIDWHYNLIESMPKIRDLYLLAFELTSKFGSPYFDNQIPAYRNAGKGISCFQCCAYQFGSSPDTDSEFNDKILFKDGKHFSMGSYQVVTFNTPRCALESKTYEDLVRLCKEKIDLAIEVFKVKKEWMNKIEGSGRVPFLSQRLTDPQDPDLLSPPLFDFDSLVFTIGVVGLNETVRKMTGYQIHEDEKAQLMAVKLMLELKTHCQKRSKETGMTIAFSRTPAETTAQRFAVMDLQKYLSGSGPLPYLQGDVEKAISMLQSASGRDLPIYYTNGTHIAVNARIPITEKIRIESAFFPIVDGGNICNIYLGEERPDPRGLMEMTLKLCKSTNLGYFAFTKDMTIRGDRYKRWQP